MTRLQQILLGTIAVLIVVWWVTQPPTSPPERNVMAETPLSWATSPADLNIETPEEPEWLSKIDTNKPECKELAEEMLRLQAMGELGDIVYLGDCTRMPLNDTP